MLNIAICDDDIIFLEFLKKNLLNILKSNCNIIAYHNRNRIIMDLEETGRNIDILFMDIDLGEINGIDLAKEVQCKFPSIKIIFISGHIEYATDIFAVKPIYFLTKPIDTNKLILSIEAAKESINEDKDKHLTIAIKMKGEIFNIKVNTIKYIESFKRMIIIHEDNERYEIYGKLDEIQEKLPNKFVRCHKSYLVNLDRVRSMTGQKFLLYSGDYLPISQTRYGETKKRFLRYLGETL